MGFASIPLSAAAFLLHTISPTCKQTVLHANSIRWGRSYTNSSTWTRRRNEHRIRKSSLSFTLRPRQILFAADNFFSTTLCVFVFHPPTLYRLLSFLSIFVSVSTSISISVPFFLSTTRRFLRQVLCTYIKSLLPAGLCVLVVRFKEIDSSSLYDVLSSRVNIKSTLVLVETRRISEDTDGDFYLCCFFRA